MCDLDRFSKIQSQLQAVEFEVAEEASPQLHMNLSLSMTLLPPIKLNQPKIFSYIRSLTKSDPIPHTVYYNDNSATNDKQKASLFNNYFILCSLLLILTSL